MWVTHPRREALPQLVRIPSRTPLRLSSASLSPALPHAPRLSRLFLRRPTRGRATVSGRIRLLSLLLSHTRIYMYLRTLNNASVWVWGRILMVVYRLWSYTVSERV